MVKLVLNACPWSALLWKGSSKKCDWLTNEVKRVLKTYFIRKWKRNEGCQQNLESWKQNAVQNYFAFEEFSSLFWQSQSPSVIFLAPDFLVVWSVGAKISVTDLIFSDFLISAKSCRTKQKISQNAILRQLLAFSWQTAYTQFWQRSVRRFDFVSRSSSARTWINDVDKTNRDYTCRS